jgi:hypothetical protein
MSEMPTVASFSKRPEIPPPTLRPALGRGHFKLGRALTILLACSIGASALGMLLDAYGIGLISTLQNDPSNYADSDGAAFDMMSLMLIGLSGLLQLATGVVTMIWLYQAYGSQEADPSLLPNARWWTIGGWFIPVISLWRPFQIIRDLYLATTSPSPSGIGLAPVVVPRSFGWWWACYLLGTTLTTAALRLTGDDAGGLGQLQASVILDLAGQAVLIAAAVLFIRVLHSITLSLWRRANA